MKAILALSVFMVMASLAATVSAKDVTRTEPSDKYGPGGTHETTSNERYEVIKEVYKDKCGRIRQEDERINKDNTLTRYYDENGKAAVKVFHKRGGGDEYFTPQPGKNWSANDKEIDATAGKALVAKLEKTPSAPCPEKEGQAQQQPQVKASGVYPNHPLLTSPLFGQPFSPSTFTWTGPYVGIQFGYTRISSDYSLKLGGLFNDIPDTSNEIESRGMHEFDENGFGFGGCAGYNYQFNNNVVIGIGVAGRKLWGLDATHNTGDFPTGNTGDFDVFSSYDTTGIVTFGPKAGYACGRFLPYVSGGLAFGELDASQKIFSRNFGIHEIGKDSDLRLGWNVAGGLQYAVTKNWSLRLEYSYSDLGTFKYPGKSSPDTFRGFTTWHMATQTEHGANAGIVYTFH